MSTRMQDVKAVVAAARHLVEGARTHTACLRHARKAAGGCVGNCPACALAALSNRLIMLDRREVNRERG